MDNFRRRITGTVGSTMGFKSGREYNGEYVDTVLVQSGVYIGANSYIYFTFPDVVNVRYTTGSTNTSQTSLTSAQGISSGVNGKRVTIYTVNGVYYIEMNPPSGQNAYMHLYVSPFLRSVMSLTQYIYPVSSCGKNYSNVYYYAVSAKSLGHDYGTLTIPEGMEDYVYYLPYEEEL